MKMKHVVPVVMAGLLTVSGIPVSAGTYSDIETKALENWTESFTSVYQNNVTQSENFLTGQASLAADLNLEVTDTVRALIGIAAPFDISWLNRAGLTFNYSIQDNLYAIAGSAYINETDLFTYEIYMDLAAFAAYAYIPQISPYYLKMDLGSAMADVPAQTLSLYTADLTAFTPDAEVIRNILNRYFTILFKHMPDGSSGESTYTVGTESLISSAYEGKMLQTDAFAFVKELLNTALTDEDLKTLIDQIASLYPEYGETLYSEFQAAISETLTEFEDDSAMVSTDDSYISSSIWTDDEQNIIGRSLSFVEDEEKTNFFKYSNLNTDTDNTFYLKVDADGTSLVLNGNGTYTDGKLTGDYELAVDDMPLAVIRAIDYDTAAFEKGAVNGSFKLTLNQGAIDDETFAYLSSFALLLDSYKDIETGAGDLTLSVTSADVPLASLNLTAAYADPFTVPDLNTLSNVLDPVNSEEDANTFISELDWTPVLDNLRTAGVPESLVEQLDTLITEELFGTGDEIYMDTDDVYENTFIEDMPSDSSAGIIGGADGPTSIIVAEEFPEEELIIVD